jgi:hypothetical protein
MECDYTYLNHNSLMSQKKVITKGVIIKGVYCTMIFKGMTLGDLAHCTIVFVHCRCIHLIDWFETFDLNQHSKLLLGLTIGFQIVLSHLKHLFSMDLVEVDLSQSLHKH